MRAPRVHHGLEWSALQVFEGNEDETERTDGEHDRPRRHMAETEVHIGNRNRLLCVGSIIREARLGVRIPH